MEPSYAYTKIDDGTLGIVKTSVHEKNIIYDLQSLNDQLESIQEQQDRDNAKRESEKSEVIAFIAKANELGIK